MNAAEMVIREAFEKCPELLKDEMRVAIAMHENHARVTHSEPAYHAALRLAAACKKSLEYIESGDIGTIAADMRLWVPTTERAERAMRLHNAGVV